MSTVPHDPSHVADAAHAASVFAPASYEQKADEAVSEFESGAYSLGIPRPPTAELRDVCRKVAAYTADLFPDGMRIKVRNDPEYTDDLYFVFEPVHAGTIDEIMALDSEWHRRLTPTVGKHAELFCLSVRPQ